MNQFEFATLTKKLRSDTKEYWDRSKGKPPRAYASHYITSLLKRELECIGERGDLPKVPCKTLVLLVGYSIEPLLQAACAYHPTDRIVLIMSKQYVGINPGEAYGNEMKEWIKQAMSQCDLTAPPIIVPKPVTANPAEVFRVLRGLLHDAEDVVVDITGAKKSMVGGAFLFATFSGATVSYVDWQDAEEAYDLDRRRPYGYAAVIGPLEPNPYDVFFLREWERARELYKQHQFRTARAILETVKCRMSPQYFDVSGQEAISDLQSVLEVYEQWERGDLQKSKQGAMRLERKGIAIKAPIAVMELGDSWPRAEDNKTPEFVAESLVGQVEDGLKPSKKNLFLNPLDMDIYAMDELRRIRRLIEYHEDYRSALMRSIGLFELLTIARAITLWKSGGLEMSLDEKATWVPVVINDPLDEKASKVYQSLRSVSYERIKSLLTYDKFYIGEKPDRIWVRRRVDLGAVFDSDLLPDALKNLRDKTTHLYLHVPPEIAKRAFVSVCRNALDFRRHWARLVDSTYRRAHLNTKDFHVLPWAEVCQLCKLTNCLPPSLLK